MFAAVKMSRTSPSPFLTWNRPPSYVMIPAASCPRCWIASRPSYTSPTASGAPITPMNPHMRRSLGNARDGSTPGGGVGPRPALAREEVGDGVEERPLVRGDEVFAVQPARNVEARGRRELSRQPGGVALGDQPVPLAVDDQHGSRDPGDLVLREPGAAPERRNLGREAAPAAPEHEREVAPQACAEREMVEDAQVAGRAHDD